MAVPIKQFVEKEVTCPLCLGLFKDPRKLPCDHVYCKDCLNGLAVHSLDNSICCPECRNVTALPNGNVAEFPTDFRMNRLVKGFLESHETTDRCRSETAEITSKKCSIHGTQPLAIYCETCKRVLCRDCVLMSQEHSRHSYNYIDEIAEKYRETHKRKLQKVKDNEELLLLAHVRASQIEAKLASEKSMSEDDIDKAFDELHAALEESKRSMKRELSQKYQSDLDTVLNHKREIEKLQDETARVTMTIEEVIESDALFTQEKVAEDRSEKLQKQIKLFPLNIDEPILPKAEIVSGEMLQDYLKSRSFFHASADPNKCWIEGSFLENAEIGESGVLSMKLVDSKGKKCLRGSQSVKAELHSLRDQTTTIGAIKYRSPSEVTIVFESLKRGRHLLYVMVRDTHVANSPKSIYVHAPSIYMCLPVTRITNLSEPVGLTKFGNGMLVTDRSSNRILKLNTSFQVDGEFGQTQLREVTDITTDKNMNIYVSVKSNHTVQKFASDGTLMISTGSIFGYPAGICVSSKDELYVCDSGNNFIQVFDLRLNFKRAFGSVGTANGQFQYPTDVGFDNNGNVYVCDSLNHRIQVFSPQERYIRSIGPRGFGGNNLERPQRLRVRNNLIIVTDLGNVCQLRVFKISGELIPCFGQGIVEQPRGVEVDVDGLQTIIIL